MVYASDETAPGAGVGAGFGAGLGVGVGFVDGDGLGFGVDVGVDEPVVPVVVFVVVPVVVVVVVVVELLAGVSVALKISEPVVAPPPQADNDSATVSTVPPTKFLKLIIKALFNINISFLCPTYRHANTTCSNRAGFRKNAANFYQPYIHDELLRFNILLNINYQISINKLLKLFYLLSKLLLIS
jgi:hypothetical protein